MAKSKYLLFLISLFSCIIISKLLSEYYLDRPTSRAIIDMNKSEKLSSDHDHTVFIVHMAKSAKPSVFISHHHWYNSILKSLPPSNHPSEILYTYEKVANGFSAILTRSEAATLKEIPGVLHVSPDRTHKLQTTHTYEFLRLSTDSGIWPRSNYGEGIIVGVLDTGITPGHRSFADTGMSPIPSTWRGFCEKQWQDFPASSCNKKLIGARAFLSGYYMSSKFGRSQKNLTAETRSPRDTDGHGTHVASTVAGAVVEDASFFGYAKGTAKGVAYKARIAAYKVCSTSCKASDIVKGMDQAVNDGVDVISMSLSGGTGDYYQDAIAIASFGAAHFDVLVSVSGGNNGPGPLTVNHVAPWVLTTGASSIDREFRADVVLGDLRTFVGSSLYAGSPFPPQDRYQLVDAGNFGNRYCKLNGFNDPTLLAGKIIVCDDGCVSTMEKQTAVHKVSGRGLIIANSASTRQELRAEPYFIMPALMIPGTRVGFNEGIKIKQYINYSPIPTATILFQGTTIGTSPPAPKVASFSGRGPNIVTSQILKPDVIAPGLDVLAAWTHDDPRLFEFNIISGTSMACPHVSGIAALLKSVYPNWSAAAIKSAIMTTAYNRDNSGQSIKDLSTGIDSTPFAHGAGHVDPNRALDPGLVYDMTVIDYVGFLCSIGYDYQKIAIIWRDEPVEPDVCDWIYKQLGAKVKPGDLNLPSFFVSFTKEVETVTYRRIVTNVGSTVNVAYTVTKYEPAGIKIDVMPNKLVFSTGNPKQKYEITFSSVGGSGDTPRFGWIEWSDGTHSVRSTIGFGWTGSASNSLASI